VSGNLVIVSLPRKDWAAKKEKSSRRKKSNKVTPLESFFILKKQNSLFALSCPIVAEQSMNPIFSIYFPCYRRMCRHLFFDGQHEKTETNEARKDKWFFFSKAQHVEREKKKTKKLKIKWIIQTGHQIRATTTTEKLEVN
jgi:hypothetical protein